MDENFKETLVYLTLSISNSCFAAPRVCEVGREVTGKAGAGCGRSAPQHAEICLCPALPRAVPATREHTAHLHGAGPHAPRASRCGNFHSRRGARQRGFRDFSSLPTPAVPKAWLRPFPSASPHKTRFSSSLLDALNRRVIKLGAGWGWAHTVLPRGGKAKPRRGTAVGLPFLHPKRGDPEPARARGAWTASAPQAGPPGAFVPRHHHPPPRKGPRGGRQVFRCSGGGVIAEGPYSPSPQPGP